MLRQIFMYKKDYEASLIFITFAGHFESESLRPLTALQVHRAAFIIYLQSFVLLSQSINYYYPLLSFIPFATQLTHSSRSIYYIRLRVQHEHDHVLNTWSHQSSCTKASALTKNSDWMHNTRRDTRSLSTAMSTSFAIPSVMVASSFPMTVNHMSTNICLKWYNICTWVGDVRAHRWWLVIDGVQMDFGFSFDAVPTIDTVLYFRGSRKEDGDRWR